VYVCVCVCVSVCVIAAVHMQFAGTHRRRWRARAGAPIPSSPLNSLRLFKSVETCTKRLRSAGYTGGRECACSVPCTPFHAPRPMQAPCTHLRVASTDERPDLKGSGDAFHLTCCNLESDHTVGFSVAHNTNEVCEINSPAFSVHGASNVQFWNNFLPELKNWKLGIFLWDRSSSIRSPNQLRPRIQHLSPRQVTGRFILIIAYSERSRAQFPVLQFSGKTIYSP
jgi:hypothetical protein